MFMHSLFRLYLFEFKKKNDVVFTLQDMKAYTGVKLELHSFMTSAVDKGNCSHLHHDCVVPRQQSPQSGQVGKGKFFFFH